jgi:hypothetical protein
MLGSALAKSALQRAPNRLEQPTPRTADEGSSRAHLEGPLRDLVVVVVDADDEARRTG